jgi:flavin-dependent dehydrogenase
VNLRNRNAPRQEDIQLDADLVVDASGRRSRAYAWLHDLGYQAPGETCINAHTGYASRIYRRPDRHPDNWKTLYVRPSPEYSSRGGIIVPLENERWHVTLVGMGGDYPPTNEAGFLEFARSLPVPDFYAAIQNAEALTRVYGYRNTENRVHWFENLPRYLEGFLVSGDAVLTLNPVYALGMTAAILGSQALERSLREQRDGDLKGLAQAFQKQLAHSTSRLWQLSTSEDLKWNETEVVETIPQAQDRQPAYRLSPEVAVAAP